MIDSSYDCYQDTHDHAGKKAAPAVSVTSAAAVISPVGTNINSSTAILILSLLSHFTCSETSALPGACSENSFLNKTDLPISLNIRIASCTSCT